MARVTITLNQEERDALIKLSERERRHPRDQAALIIRQGLEQAGFLDPVVVTPGVPPLDKA